MADPLTVLFKTNPDRRVQIGAVLLDATIEERHEYSSQVTQHPIETGGFVTDHVYEDPRHVSINGEITESPVVFFSVFNGLSDRRVEAYDQLLALYRTRDVVTLVTGLKVYTDMVMKSFSVPRNQRTGRRLQFTAEFEEVRKAESEVVGVAEQKASAENADKVSDEKDVGRQETTTANDSVQEKANTSSSLLAKVL